MAGARARVLFRTARWERKIPPWYLTSLSCPCGIFTIRLSPRAAYLLEAMARRGPAGYGTPPASLTGAQHGACSLNDNADIIIGRLISHLL